MDSITDPNGSTTDIDNESYARIHADRNGHTVTIRRADPADDSRRSQSDYPATEHPTADGRDV